MDKAVTQYLAEIGRRGGRKSRRVLDPKAASQMVRTREAKRAFVKFHTRCFWSAPKDYRVTAKDIPWIAKQLITHGGREGWVIGKKLCP